MTTKENQDSFRDGCLYIRVSTHGQEELSPDAQKRLLLDYAKSHDIFIAPQHIFVENGISGRKADKRPEFQRMISLAKSEERPFSAILVWKYSRFARNQEESIVYKSMLKKQCGVDVISITEPLIDGPFGSLIERIIEWMDEYYSINLSGEVVRGMTENAMRGKYQSTPSLGYRSPGYGIPFEVVPEEADIVKFIFHQYVDHHKDVTAIARLLNERGAKTKRGNVFEKRNVCYILKNKFYIGKLIWNDIETDGSHETFISEELFQKANDRLNAEFKPKKRRNVSACKHWLSGLVKCSICGASLVFTNNGKSPFFQCWKYAKGMHPKSNMITEKALIKGVLEYFDKLLGGADFTFTYRSPASAEPDDTLLFRQQLEKLSSREQRIRDAYEAGIDTLEEYRENKTRLLLERKRLTDLIESSKPSVSKPEDDKEQILSRIRTVYDVLKDENTDYETKGVFIRSVIEYITWDKENRSMTFHLYMP